MLLVSAARREGTLVLQELQTATASLKQQHVQHECEAQPEQLLDAMDERLQGQQQAAAVVVSLYRSVEAWGSRLPHNDQLLVDDLLEAERGYNRARSEAAARLGKHR